VADFGTLHAILATFSAGLKAPQNAHSAKKATNTLRFSSSAVLNKHSDWITKDVALQSYNKKHSCCWDDPDSSKSIFMEVKVIECN
jgi:hypothetical protein